MSDRDPSPRSSPPKTVLEQVRRWAPPGSVVTEAGFQVPGVELFRISDGKPLPQDAYPTYMIVAVAGGLGQPILQGDEAMRAVIRATRDPVKLAEIALAINRRAALLLRDPRDIQQRNKGVAGPAIAGNSLDFWIMTGSPGMTLMRARLDLATGKLELGDPASSSDDVIADAIKALAGANYEGALDTLKQHCTDAKARTALFDALANASKEDLRWRAAMAVEACDASAVEPLIKALETDKSVTVRTAAARVLGRLRDPRAKPALEKASREQDAHLASAARDALRELL